MRKIKILGISKSTKRNIYTFEKKQEFLKGFMNFLLELGIKDWEVNRFGYVPDSKCYDEPLIGKYKQVMKFIDERFVFTNDNYVIDLIFGKNKIFLIITTKKDEQNELSKKLLKFASIKKIKKIRTYN